VQVAFYQTINQSWHRRKIVDAAFLQHAEENYLTRKSSISHVHQIRLSPSSDTAFTSWWSGYWAKVVPNLSKVQGKLVFRFRVLPNRPIRDELGYYRNNCREIAYCFTPFSTIQALIFLIVYQQTDI